MKTIHYFHALYDWFSFVWWLWGKETQSHPLTNTEVLWLFKHPVEFVSHINNWLGAFLVTTKIKEDSLCFKGTADNRNRTRHNLLPSDFLPGIFHQNSQLLFLILSSHHSEMDHSMDRWHLWNFHEKKKIAFLVIYISQKGSLNNLEAEIWLFASHWEFKIKLYYIGTTRN